MSREKWAVYAGIIERTKNLKTARGGGRRVEVPRGRIMEARLTIAEADESPEMAVVDGQVVDFGKDDMLCKHLRTTSNSREDK
jgi:hypothetical protein